MGEARGNPGYLVENSGIWGKYGSISEQILWLFGQVQWYLGAVFRA